MADRGNRLAGKVAVVTGAGSSGAFAGTGKAISVLFARQGAKVVLVDQVEERAKETLATIEAEGGEAFVCLGDVTVARDCEAVAKAAVDRFGRLDILVNNVGVNRTGDVLDVTEDDWDFVAAVNLKAMMLTSKHAVPHMIESGGGSIIQISSTGAVRPNGASIAYDATKGGVISLTIGLAVELGRHGIRVNCIMPGRMVTPMTGESWRARGVSETERLENRRLNLLGLLGDAWDVAWAAVFLASDEARWLTSVTLPVDGGFLYTPPDYRPHLAAT